MHSEPDGHSCLIHTFEELSITQGISKNVINFF